MPTRIIIEHYHASSGRRWTNRYFTTDAWTAAGTTMDALVAAHRAIMPTSVIITKVRVDDNVEETNNYDTVAINQAGLVDYSSQEMLPLWNTARVDFDVAGGGSPSRKFLRAVLAESNTNFMQLHPNLITALNTYGDAIVAIGTICDPQGQLFVDAVPWPSPQMRQQNRKKKKKSIP